jgi:hypothetical protein
MSRRKLAPDLIRGGCRFADKGHAPNENLDRVAKRDAI